MPLKKPTTKCGEPTLSASYEPVIKKHTYVHSTPLNMSFKTDN